MHFPQDEYTPFGYLDIPGHSRNLTPRGVLRSHDVGFRWHFPAYAGSYGGRREIYRAGVRLAVDGALAMEEYDRAISPYHSRSIFAFDLEHGAARIHSEWLPVGEHALHASVTVLGARRICLHVEYTRLLSANGEWGESGLVGRFMDGLLILQCFEDGEAFVLWTSASPLEIGVTADPALAASWATQPAPGIEAGFVTTLGERNDTVALHGVLVFGPAGDQSLEMIMARGKTVPEAQAHLQVARRAATGERARLIADDDAFWSRAPRLAGDWPAHWRRGLVYDLETIRMMVKAPLGVYRHIWDAMQIQAPRVVLAEAAMDALILSYADPGLAQELMLGTFADAALPNVPCSREDGTFNMVAADGTICGTAPEWGYPWLVLQQLDALEPNPGWLEQLYPRLAAYLDWWLLHRHDLDGWLHYACSWESGQDNSPRFGEQPLGGGHPTRHIRPVDLHAAVAHATSVMASFARTLGYTDDVTKWETQAAHWREQTASLWNNTRYADFDTQHDTFTTEDDIMLLAPLALGVADTGQIMASCDAITALDADRLVWPMFAWTAVEAAMRADKHDKAAILAAAICERAYTFWDARQLAPDRTLPGISCEYWPPSGRCGGEGYGWGAFTTHLVLHTLLGFRPQPAHLELRPNLPPDWRIAGRTYRARLHARGRALTISLEPLDAIGVRLTVNDQMTDTGWGTATTFDWDALAGS